MQHVVPKSQFCTPVWALCFVSSQPGFSLRIPEAVPCLMSCLGHGAAC